MENPLDNSPKIGDNVYNYDENELGDKSVMEIIKMDEHEPINDASCQHERLIPDPNDTIGDAVYHGCANQKCGLGWYLRPKT